MGPSCSRRRFDTCALTFGLVSASHLVEAASTCPGTAFPGRSVTFDDDLRVSLESRRADPSSAGGTATFFLWRRARSTARTAWWQGQMVALDRRGAQCPRDRRAPRSTPGGGDLDASVSPSISLPASWRGLPPNDQDAVSAELLEALVGPDQSTPGCAGGVTRTLGAWLRNRLSHLAPSPAAEPR